jgi:ribonuclease R
LISSHLDSKGVCTRSEVSRVRIRSRGKLSFGGVQAFYEGGAGFGDDVDTNLRHLATVGKRRMSLAEERGVVRYRRVTASTDLGKGGLRFTAIREVRLEVERYNEQLSLLCNSEGARLLSESSEDFVEPVYRAHPAPSEKKMRDFEKALAALVQYHKLPETWAWSRQSEATLRDYLDGLPSEGKEGRIASAIHRQAVMANVRSMFQTEAAAHHGVGAEVYARFSAPMREMVGVFLHRELFQAMVGKGHADEDLRTKIVNGANEAKSVQRAVVNESNRLVLDQIFEDALANKATLPAVLMGAARDKAYVRLQSPPIDAKVYLGRGEEVLRARGDGAGLSNATQQFGLGDEITLTVLGRDDRDRWKLEIA